MKGRAMSNNTTDRLRQAIDRIKVLEDHADDTCSRVNVLEAKVTMLYTLRKSEREITARAWEEQLREATEDEAETLTPDNRVDGNGIRIADLEAVEDELTS